MSGIIVLPIVMPVISAAWPVLISAAGSAAASLGYAVVKTPTKNTQATEVKVDVTADAVAETMGMGQELVFSKGDVQIIFSRACDGKLTVKALGRNKSESELKKTAKQFADAITQQYAYHKIMTELKQRNLNLVSEEIDEDGTVRLQVRTFQS